MKAPRI